MRCFTLGKQCPCKNDWLEAVLTSYTAPVRGARVAFYSLQFSEPLAVSPLRGSATTVAMESTAAAGPAVPSRPAHVRQHSVGQSPVLGANTAGAGGVAGPKPVRGHSRQTSASSLAAFGLGGSGTSIASTIAPSPSLKAVAAMGSPGLAASVTAGIADEAASDAASMRSLRRTYSGAGSQRFWYAGVCAMWGCDTDRLVPANIPSFGLSIRRGWV